MQDHTLLDGVRGQGHYVGTYLAWGVNNNGWWGEGEMKFFMDGDAEWPTICGTGTEDYFGGAWCFEQPQGEYGRVFDALPRLPSGDQAGRFLRQPAALRAVPLARHGPDPLQRGPARDDPGAGLAVEARRSAALSAAAGRHRVHGLLVSDGTARALPRSARHQRSGSDLESAAQVPCCSSGFTRFTGNNV